MLTDRIAPLILLVSIVMLTVSFGGCIPGVRTVSPGVKGVVIDQTTKSPLECARVYLRERPDTLTLTDSHGCFAIKARLGLGVVALIGDAFCTGTLVAEKAGYNCQEDKVVVMDGRTAHVTFELSPKSDPSP